MPLSDNSQFLVTTLQALPLLDGRFKNIKLVNFNSLNNQKRGNFSLVFSAHDIIEDVTVALKFYDIREELINNDYRLACFRREHAILQVMMNKNRCLQLVSPLSTYSLVIQTGHGRPIKFPCEYFAVEWIEEDIDEFFFLQENIDSINKLHLFNELTLAVEALHRQEIFHRDLKQDNFKQYQEAVKRIVVAIDLGTAARYDSGKIQQDYQYQVGHSSYAAPETFYGLAGHRKLAPYTDCYALGCMLYELFNRDFFIHAWHVSNPRGHMIRSVMGIELQGKIADSDRLKAWNLALRKYSFGFEPVRIDGLGSSVPKGIASILNDVIRSLTHVDFSYRPINLEWVRIRIWAAINTLQNEKLYQKKLAAAKEMRSRRIEKQIQKESALRRRIADKSSSC